MMAIALWAILLGPTQSNAPAAQEPGAFHEPGETQDWQREVPLMRGDKYATAVLTIDKKGRPVRCGLKDTNIHDSDLAFFICKSFEDDWHTKPLLNNGVPVSGTVERHVTMRGHRGQKALDDAWQRYRATHPDAVRPD